MDGQTALMCQLCENDSKLRWKCLECRLLMCERCKDKVHPKFASADDHTIIDIKEISENQTDPEPKLGLARLKCKVHPGRNCCMFCKTCQDLVCLTCIEKTHNKHDFSEINHEYHTKLEKIKTMGEEFKTGLESLTIRQRELTQIKSTGQSKYDILKQEILDYDLALVNEIKKHTDKLLKELDQKWKAVSKSIEDEEKDLEVKKGQIQQQNQEINDLLQSEDADSVFSVPDSLLESRKADVTSDDTSMYEFPRFIQGNRRDISRILGKLEYVTLSKTEYDTYQLRKKKKGCTIL